MKTLKFNNWSINENNKNKYLRILELKNKLNTFIDPDTFLYKNTINKVNKEMIFIFGKKLDEIPCTFIKDNVIYKSSLTTFKNPLTKRISENFTFLPMYSL